MKDMTTNNGEQVVLVAIDDGYDSVKVLSSRGHKLNIGSRARSGRSQIGSIDGEHSNVYEYETGSMVFSAGNVNGEPTHFDGYPVSPLNRVIVQHALQLVGLGGHRLTIATGLPIHTYYRNGVVNEKLVDHKIQNLLTKVVPLGRGEPAAFVDHIVLPEGISAWYDYVIDEIDGQGVKNAERAANPVGIIDMGGRTTDYTVISEEGIEFAHSGSINAGIIDIKERVAEQLCAAFDLNEISERRLDTAVREGVIRFYGKDHDVKQHVSDAARYVIDRIYTEARRRIGAGAELEKVLFVGGGSLRFRDAIRNWFPNSNILPEPEFANARGMLKFLRYVHEPQQ